MCTQCGTADSLSLCLSLSLSLCRLALLPSLFPVTTHTTTTTTTTTPLHHHTNKHTTTSHSPSPHQAIPESIPLDVVYEDQHLIVVNKVKCMTSGWDFNPVLPNVGSQGGRVWLGSDVNLFNVLGWLVNILRSHKPSHKTLPRLPTRSKHLAHQPYPVLYVLSASQRHVLCTGPRHGCALVPWSHHWHPGQCPPGSLRPASM